MGGARNYIKGTGRPRSEISWCNFSWCVAFRRLTCLTNRRDRILLEPLTALPNSAAASPSVSAVAFHKTIYLHSAGNAFLANPCPNYNIP